MHERPLWAADPSTFPATRQWQPGQWYDIKPQGTEIGTPWHGDFTFYGVNQAFTLSSDQSNDPGKSIVIAHQVPFDNLDPGLCSCTVHGGLERGAGVLHPTLIPPVAPGTFSILARKKVIFPQGTNWFSETDGYKGERRIPHRALRAERIAECTGERHRHRGKPSPVLGQWSSTRSRHKLKDKAEAAYQRGTLLQKRKRLMQEWAEFLKVIYDESNMHELDAAA